jgi:hypothetical protein
MQNQQANLDESSPAPTVSPSLEARPRAPKAMVFTRFPLPSDRVPFQIHFEILARFVTHSRNGQEPIAADKIEGEGVPKQAAQMNVKFLTNVGLLKFDSKGLYLPSPETIRFVNAKTVGDDRARPILRSLIQSTWFAEIATSVLRMRPVVTDDALIGELALAAETNKEKKGPSLRVLVEYLVWSGIISRDEKGLSLGSDAFAASAETGSSTPPTPTSLSLPAAVTDRRPGVAPLTATEGGTWHIVQTEDFFLKVRSDPDIIEDLRDQLSLLSKKIQRLRAKQPGGNLALDAVEAPRSPK